MKAISHQAIVFLNPGLLVVSREPVASMTLMAASGWPVAAAVHVPQAIHPRRLHG